MSVKDLKEMYLNGPHAGNKILLWCDGKDVFCKCKFIEETSTERPMFKHSNVANSSHEENVEDLIQP